jgi:alpha/beta superfamily hydrolase
MRGHHTRRRSSDRSRAGSAALPIVHPNPLQAGEDRGQLVAALERQLNIFDGDDLQIGLGWEVVAPGG